MVREFVIVGHGNLAKVEELLGREPRLLNMTHEWNPGDSETAIQGAAHVGHAAIAEYLLGQGAPLEICTAAPCSTAGVTSNRCWLQTHL